MRKEVKIYITILAFVALGMGMSFEIISNYLKEVYNVTTVQRGFIEIPREFPGVIIIFLVSIFAFVGDYRLSAVAFILPCIGFLILAIFTPVYWLMLLILFFISLGLHVNVALRDSMALKFNSNSSMEGKSLGIFRSISKIFSLIAAIIVYLTFKYDVFSFTNGIIYNYLIASVLFLLAAILFIYLVKITGDKPEKRKVSFLYRKEYNLYYILTILNGAQKQVFLVYGPWVLIQILNKGVEAVVLPTIIGLFLAIFFVRVVGKLVDKFGVKALLFVDAFSFIFVYLLYGFITLGFENGLLPLIGIPVIIVNVIIIIDIMSMEMGMVRTLYLKTILVEENDLSRTISLGVSLDHVVSLTMAVAAGFVWYYLGSYYVFFGIGVLSITNVIVAFKVKDIKKSTVNIVAN